MLTFLFNFDLKVPFTFRCSSSFYFSMLRLLLNSDSKVPFPIPILLSHVFARRAVTFPRGVLSHVFATCCRLSPCLAVTCPCASIRAVLSHVSARRAVTCLLMFIAYRLMPAAAAPHALRRPRPFC